MSARTSLPIGFMYTLGGQVFALLFSSRRLCIDRQHVVSRWCRYSVPSPQPCLLSGQAGMTLIETLIALATLAILISTTSVTLGSLAPKFNLDNGTRLTAMALHQAKMQAVTRGRSISVAFDSDGFSVFDTEEPTDVLSELDMPTGVSLTADGGVEFTAMGTATFPRSISVSNGPHYRLVSVGFTGEVQVQ